MRLPLKPSLLTRKLVAKPWGGRGLERVPGLRLPALEQIGESWEVYDRPEGSSRLSSDGRALSEWMSTDPLALLGPGVATATGRRFPLLIKFIDAREALSVQVHPDDAQAAAAGDSGKSEAWVVLAAGPEARIIRGVRPGVSREQFAAAVRSPAVEGLLAAFAPRAGDAIEVPAGVVHAIGPDVVLYEIQQNSDITYRLYDWGRDRELHLEQGLVAARLDMPVQTVVEPMPTLDDGEWLFRNRHFTLRRYRFDGPMTLPSEGTFKIGTVISGRGTLGWRSGGEDPPVPLTPGDSVLVPACVKNVFVSPVGAITLLWAGPGVAR
jgi:mannose-6-phosphate isomerase